MIEGIRYDLYYVSLYLEHLLLGQCDHKTSSQKKDIIYDKLDKEINFFIDLFELKKIVMILMNHGIKFENQVFLSYRVPT